MAPKEGNSIVKHGVLDERLNVHDVKGLKVADLSICPDNVGCNTYVSIPHIPKIDFHCKKRLTPAAFLDTRRRSSSARSAPCSWPRTWATRARHWK